MRRTSGCNGSAESGWFLSSRHLPPTVNPYRSPNEIACRYRASHVAMNPYDPPNDSNETAGGRNRWVRRFLMLNGILLAFPVSIITFVYGSLWIETALLPDTINGDPVTYQHEFIGISGPVWPMVAFFVVPNIVLFAVYAVSVFVRRSTVYAQM